MVLDDICVLIADCPHSTAPDEGSGYPLIRTPNIGKARFLLDGVHRVSKQVYEQRNKRATPQDNDIIFAREAPAGNAAIIKNGDKYCLGQRTVLIRPDPQKVNPDYLAYYLLAPEQQHKLLSTAHGATVSHVNIPDIHNMNVDNLPSIEIQKQVADMLIAYDDLIENNQKQIKLLEEGAQRLYKEWFIDLRFPGHESTPIHDGIPEGWERKTVADVCETVGGGTPSTSKPEYYDGGTIHWVTPSDLTKKKSLILLETEKRITQDGYDNSSAKMVPPETILMTSRASIGYFALCEHEVCTNQGFISCIPASDNLRFFLLFNLMNRIDEIKGKATGSTFLEIAKRTFREMRIVVPTENLLTLFTKQVKPIISQIRVLEKGNVKLTQARDRLLPKLMSGEIEV